MTSTPEPDARLIGAHDLALAALHEITPASTVGPAADYAVEADGVVSLRFENRLPGYPGWYWTVSVAVVDDAEPTVLEMELLPGDGALLAPEWVPWAERLAEYRAHQAQLAEQAAQAADAEALAALEAAALNDELDDDIDDDDELDDDDADELDDDADDAIGALLHSGDLDGVDIDALDDSAPEYGLDEDIDVELPLGDAADDEDADDDAADDDAADDDADEDDADEDDVIEGDDEDAGER